MALITASLLTLIGANTLTQVTLDNDDDTFTYRFGTKQKLILFNPTESAIAGVNIVADEVTTVPVQGAANLNVSTGYTLPSIPAGGMVALGLDSIRAYISPGVISITGGTGLKAILLQGD